MKKVLLLLANGFEIYEAGVFIDVIGWNYIDGDRNTKLYSCGIDRNVNSSFGQKMVVDFLIEEIFVEDYDALAIPGGFDEYNFYEDTYDEKFLNLIREFHDKGKIIASVCVASLALGKSGILEGKRATCYNKKEGIRQKTLGEFGVNVVNEPVVEDSNIITCWNLSTAMDVAFLLLEKLTNKKNTDFIKEIMGF